MDGGLGHVDKHLVLARRPLGHHFAVPLAVDLQYRLLAARSRQLGANL